MWRYLTGCILIVIGAYFYMIFPGMERKREIWKFRGTQWAHRGLHDKKSGIPENSMAAFREAIRANKGIELDVHLTKDKKIAVFHDDSLKRMCKGSGTIEEKTWEELKKLRLLETAEPIPLLEDVLHLVQGKVPILIELKLLTEDMEICRCLAKTMEELKGRGLWFVCADMDGDAMYDVNLKGPIGLVIGNEGEGVSRLVRETCDFTASIPMRGEIDSLNASVAAGVLAYEIVRQRTR